METIVNSIVKAYISIMGEEKWNSLSEAEQHDAIMILAKDFLKTTTD